MAAISFCRNCAPRYSLILAFSRERLISRKSARFCCDSPCNCITALSFLLFTLFHLRSSIPLNIVLYLSIFSGHLNISMLYESCQDIFSCFLDYLCYY
nr:MAG TPA: hypothetical protein [Caudoviricetes sp.]